MTTIFDISLCPTCLERDGDTVDENALLGRIRTIASEVHGAATFACLQIGHNQGDEWAKAWQDGKRNDTLAEELLNEHLDWTDAEVYMKTEPTEGVT